MSRRWAIGLALLCLNGYGPARALDRDSTLHDLRHTSWGPRDGTPGAIYAIAQTRDGYLWMGNAAGLFRFDGLRFERFDLPRDDRISSLNIFGLMAPVSGGLWIGFTFGGAAFLNNGKMTVYKGSDGLPAGSVKAFAQQQDGTVWAGTANGLAWLEGSRWHKAGPEQRYSDTRTDALMTDSAGTLWAASRNKVLFLRKGERQFRESAFKPVDPEAIGLAESQTGVVWLWNDQTLTRLQQNDNIERRATSSRHEILFDRDGALWAPTGDRGVVRIAHPERLTDGSLSTESQVGDVLGQKDGLTGNGNVAGNILEDTEGNVWFTTNFGLDRFSERRMRRGPPDKADPATEGVPFYSRTASIAAGDNGALWVGRAASSPLIEYHDQHATLHKEITEVTCSYRSGDGSLWFGTTDALWKYGSGRFERTPMPDDAAGSDVQAIAQDASGALWVSIVGQGVSRLVDGAWVRGGGIAALPKLTAIALSTDARGRVWFGYTEGRVAMLDGSKVEVFADATRLTVGNVAAFYERRKHIWAGGEFGLALFDGGRFRAFESEATNAFSNLTGIVETADGDLWLNSNAGVVHVAAGEVARAVADPSVRVQTEIFDALDGVEGTSARIRPLPTAIETSDGELWFLRDIDLYSISPAQVHRNTVPPPVVIRSLTAGDRSYATKDRLTLPKRTTSLRFDYVGLSLTMAEKVRYRYKLDGVDDGWQESHGQRYASYTNLAPGPHHFHVIAANNDGVWNASGATLDFVILPTFAQTGWFVAMCVVVGVATVLALVGLRVRQLSARMRLRFDERMAERERIARELHDTLLQGTQGLIFGVQAATNHVPSDAPARAMLEQALVRADRVMAEGRDRIQDLRIPPASNGALSTSLAAVGDELGRGRNETTFRVVVEGTARTLVPGPGDEAYGIAREALVNAFRHAEARSIEVQVIYADEGLRLRIRDDGVGIDPDTVNAGARPDHWGLQGMRERALRIGGRFDLWSRPGAGTEIELVIPAAVAYPGRKRRRRWGTLRQLAGGGG